MKYKNNLTLTNPRRVPFSLSNRFDDTFGLTDMVSDCKNAEDFCAAANKYDRFHLKWKIDKDSKNETRLTCKDTFGNIDYLIAYKEDSGLPEIPTGNMITELRSRGYSVSVDKPEKIISKKDLGKLFQEAADTDQDELDFYSQLVSAGITVRDVFEYAGPEQADTMFRFCRSAGNCYVQITQKAIISIAITVREDSVQIPLKIQMMNFSGLAFLQPQMNMKFIMNSC